MTSGCSGVFGDGGVDGTESDDGGSTGTATGTARVTSSTLPVGTQIAKLAPTDVTGDFQGFGDSVALSSDGSTAFIGATVSRGGYGAYPPAGSAYLFSRTADGWTEQGKIFSDDSDLGEWFGNSVALSGDARTALVGAPYHSADVNTTGARYVFSRGGGPGLLPGDTPTQGPGKYTGAAYVFARTDGTWRQQAFLLPDDLDSEDHFGRRVALADDGDPALVASSTDAYLFERDDGGWSRIATLPDGNPIALSGGTAFVGRSVYVSERATDGWTRQTRLDTDGDDQGGWLHAELSDDGTTALLGQPNDSDPNGTNAGAAYVFRRTGEDWRQEAKLVAGDGDANDRFGSSVALTDDGDTALVGAMNDEDPNGDNPYEDIDRLTAAGSAYLFDRNGGAWEQRAKLAASDGDPRDAFGYSVALAGDTALVGANSDEDPNGGNAGSAYVFRA
mgnify:CR=1 FL=1